MNISKGLKLKEVEPWTQPFDAEPQLPGGPIYRDCRLAATREIESEQSSTIQLSVDFRREVTLGFH